MRNFRVFMATFTITLCVLGLGVGLFTVGYNSRRIAQGDSAPNPSYKLQNGQFILVDAAGNAVKLAVVDENAHTAPLTPAPTRLSLHLLRGVAALAEKLAEKLG